MRVWDQFRVASIAAEVLVALEDHIPLLLDPMFCHQRHVSTVIRVPALRVALGMRKALVVVGVSLLLVSPLLALLLLSRRRGRDRRAVVVHGTDSLASTAEETQHLALGEVVSVYDVGVYSVLEVAALERERVRGVGGVWQDCRTLYSGRKR